MGLMLYYDVVQVSVVRIVIEIGKTITAADRKITTLCYKCFTNLLLT